MLSFSPASSSEQLARLVAGLIFLLAASYTVWQAVAMGDGMSMPGGWTMPTMWMAMPGQSLWSAARVFLIMWAAMMIAMMLPSTWPMLSLYRRVAVSSHQKHISLGTLLVGFGYFFVWTAFGAAAFAGGVLISHAAMSSERLSRAIPAGAGAALILAGLYQLSSIKQACLLHCRSPLLLFGHLWRPGMLGALRVGVAHGAYCAACCWALMLMQMILGVMSLFVMTLIAALIAIEKLWIHGPVFARIVGAVAVAAGMAIIIYALR